MLIDKYMPAFHVSSRHQVRVRAPVGVVFQTVRHLEFQRSILIRILFWIRRVPRSMMSMRALTRDGMLLLEERPDGEFVLGIIGRFWRSHHIDRDDVSARDFLNYRAQGCSKAVWNFDVRAQEDGFSLLSTETRVYCPDDVTRRMFKLYWFFAGPFSGMIRRLLLRRARREAEKEARDLTPDRVHSLSAPTTGR